MNAYLVLELAINDFTDFSHYIAAIPAHFAGHDGRYIVKSAVPTCIEVDWRPQRMVIIEFPRLQCVAWSTAYAHRMVPQGPRRRRFSSRWEHQCFVDRTQLR